MGELVRLAIPDLPDENNWSNLNPENIVDILSKNFDLGTMVNFFSRTGIGLGYLDRPCIDPLDPTCPKMSPNYFDACPGIQRLEDHLMRENKTLDSWLVVEEEKKAETSFLDIFGAFSESNLKKFFFKFDFSGTSEFRQKTIEWDKERRLVDFVNEIFIIFFA